MEIKDGAIVTQKLSAIAHRQDGTTGDITSSVTWSTSSPHVGTVDAKGLYTPSGQLGGAVTITATLKQPQGATLTGKATLTVKLHLDTDVANASPQVQTALKAATDPDPTITWAYPYDGTVFPRGLGGPTLMWNGGQATDIYYIHVVSSTFEIESFVTAPPPAAFPFADADWQKLTGSTLGQTKLTVARWDGTKATALVHHTWTVAAAEMRGTIYYWANNKGRVMRIKPGAVTPDDFSAGTFEGLPGAACTMTCHTVSADGSTLVSGGDTLGGSYDLKLNKPRFDTGGTPGSLQKREWNYGALTPNGKYMVGNGFPVVPAAIPPGPAALVDTSTGKAVPNSGLDGVALGEPAFAPTGTLLAYLDFPTTLLPGVGIPIPIGSPSALRVFDFDMNALKATNARTLVEKGTGDTIANPSVAPDAKWIIYHRGAVDTRFGPGDLYLASTQTSGQEIRLAALDGDKYPFAAGARDLHLNFEPTFAPVPSGGYFWVVFTSRRTYGNQLIGDRTTTKQLCVAAIDQAPNGSADPSHPPFLLPGQDLTSLNMRGYWALDPCKGDGQGCQSGTECCGGYCDGSSGGGGGMVCGSAQQSCAQDGDHCDKTSDCCSASAGVTCIAHVCAEPTPQ
jgi:hypothetical protein